MLTIKLFVILLVSSVATFALMIPFINLLYKLKFQDTAVSGEDMLGRKSAFNDLRALKVGTPTGGGIAVIAITLLASLVLYVMGSFSFTWASVVVLLTFLLFGLWGLWEDWGKIKRRTGVKGDTKGLALRVRHKMSIQLVLSLLIGWVLVAKLGISGFYLPLGVYVNLGWFFVPVAAAFITFFSNAFNITDGEDGLAGGLLMMSLLAIWVLGSYWGGQEDVLLFSAVLLGAIFPFMYFNVNPARVFMGDTGALAFGAFLAVAFLLSRHPLALFVVGGVYVVEALSTLIQWGSMLLRNGQRVFKIAPLHHHFEALGWDETKVTMRFWLAGAFATVVGVLVGLI